MKRLLTPDTILKMLVLGVAIYNGIIGYELIAHFWLGLTWVVVQTITIGGLLIHWMETAPRID